MFLEWKPKRPRAGFNRAASFIERKEHGMLAAFRRRDCIGQRQRRLSDAGAADEKCVGASLEAAAQELIELGIAARCNVTQERFVMLGRNQAWENPKPAGRNDEVMEAAAERNASHLDDPQAAALGAIFEGKLFQHHDAVGN